MQGKKIIYVECFFFKKHQFYQYIPLPSTPSPEDISFPVNALVTKVSLKVIFASDYEV